MASPFTSLPPVQVLYFSFAFFDGHLKGPWVQDYVVMASVDSSVLDERCSLTGVLFAKISEEIVKWEELAPYFGLTEAEVHEIKANCTHQYKEQKHNMLWKWAKKQGDKVTNRELRSVFQKAGESLLVSKVDELLQNVAYLQVPHNVVKAFQKHLKDCYCCKPATQEDCEPLQLPQSSFLNPNLVFKKSDHNGDSKSLDIKDICKIDKNVVLEGTAGSGKTTLTRHICQQWAEGNMFHDIDFLIHLTLADPASWSPKSLKDMIPYPSAEMRRAVANQIMEQQGKRCCFILDGWEDLPEGSSYIDKLVEYKLEIPYCLFIVTSRPSATASLQPLVPTTIEITGFSHENFDTYATQYLTQVGGKDPTVFKTANHYVRGLCSIPINAAILLHLLLTIQTGLPTTQTELFKCFILNLLLHRLEVNLVRSKVRSRKVRRLREFSDLPQNEKQVFDDLCLIAHQCTFSGKASFHSNRLLSSDDLHEAELNDTLGLMKVHQQLTWFGYASHYGFLHSSVQDFLCAVRMTQLSPEEQVRDFSLLLNSNPTSLVLHFYAGLTGLSSRPVCELLRDIGRNPPGYECMRQQLLADQFAGGDPRRRFLTYLHCLYEANIPDVLVKHEKSKESILTQVNVMFFSCRLTIHDLNVIAYYIMSMARTSTDLTCIKLSFNHSFIDDDGYEAFVATITEQAQSRSSTRSVSKGYFELTTGLNTYTHRGVIALASLIFLENVPLFGLNIQCANFLSLKKLIESFSSPTAGDCRDLDISDSGLTSRHAHHLILLLTQARNLLEINLSFNPGLRGAIPLLLSAAKHLTTINLVDMIDDQELLEMAPVLQSNTSLKHLRIFSAYSQSRTYSKESLVKFVQIVTAPESKSQLEDVVFGHRSDNEDIATRLPAELTNMASSRSHSLKLRHICEVFSSVSQGGSAIAPIVSTQGDSTIAPLASTQGDSTIAPLASTQGDSTIAPLASTQGDSTIAPLASTQGDSTIAPLAATQGDSTIAPLASLASTQGGSTIAPL